MPVSTWPMAGVHTSVMYVLASVPKPPQQRPCSKVPVKIKSMDGAQKLIKVQPRKTMRDVARMRRTENCDDS